MAAWLRTNADSALKDAVLLQRLVRSILEATVPDAQVWPLVLALHMCAGYFMEVRHLCSLCGRVVDLLHDLQE